MEKIKDFGEHIGGAKKENWKGRGLSLRDLEEMNPAERARYVTKDSVWPRPDYKADPEGRDRITLYSIKLVRNCLPTTPDRPSDEDEQEDYIEKVTCLRRMFWSGCHDYQDILDSAAEIRKRKDILWAFGKLPGVLSKIGSRKTLEREIRKKEFLFTEEEKLMKPYSFFEFNPADMAVDEDGECLEFKAGLGTYHLYPDKTLRPDFLRMEDGKWFAVRNSRVTLTGFNSRKEAYDACLALERAAKQDASEAAAANKPRKIKYRPPHLEHVERIGGNDILKGRKATGGDIMRLFTFRGGEFGNWVGDKERQICMDLALESFYDLAGALGISNAAVGLSGRLAIAFGARGQGAAAAHYEPEREVINLTKLSGAGSLAHEWIHSLDDHLGKELQLGGMLTENMHSDRLPESFTKLMRTIKTRQYSPEETARRMEESIESMKSRFSNDLHAISRKHEDSGLEKERNRLIKEVVAECSDAKMQEFFKLRNLRDPAMTPAYAAFAGFQKEHGDTNPSCRRNIAWSASQQAVLSVQCRRLTEDVQPITGNTGFYMDAIKLGGVLQKSGGYWESDTELLARAGAAYVKDKCLENGVRNDYLIGHADAAKVPVNGGYAYISPQGAERKAINAAFDSFFEEMKELGLLKPRTPQDDGPFRPCVTDRVQKGIDESCCRQVTIYDWLAAAQV